MDGSKLSAPLTIREVEAMFDDLEVAKRYPIILTLQQAADLAQIPLETLRAWRSAGQLNGCSTKVGKHVRILRDRFVLHLFSHISNETRKR